MGQCLLKLFFQVNIAHLSQKDGLEALLGLGDEASSLPKITNNDDLTAGF